LIFVFQGKDATEAFERQKHSEKARKWMKDFEIGSLGGQPKKWQVEKLQCSQTIKIEAKILFMVIIISVRSD